jgi:hypothetical protein
MTKEEIIRMAREAGLVDPMVFYASYERFANLVAAHKAEVALAEAYRCGYEAGVVGERESCAKVCERDDSIRCLAAAQAIRARGAL